MAPLEGELRKLRTADGEIDVLLSNRRPPQREGKVFVYVLRYPVRRRPLWVDVAEGRIVDVANIVGDVDDVRDIPA